ncbi:hypothetical protein P5P86_10415 [Nocardioides sp. BP30]|uniref:DUF7144 family membrane protein n=1 Tax=Nocardioides sp. BP30 TaxID=3036374 RepID=UPI002469B092|nr:hypothetical protein [Nocardioides sp. BP30]WGL50381.1 hypothetical protein P5P86_10415 [Nocardioides sp. BP30]
MSTTSPRRDDDDNPARGMLSLSTAIFAACMLSMIGILQVLQGIAAVADDKIYVTGIDYAYEFDVSAWGWIHIAVGAVALAVGVGILTNQTWGRLGGIVVGVVGAIANFLFLPYYPFWSLVLVGFNALVIWALCFQIGSDRRSGY